LAASSGGGSSLTLLLFILIPIGMYFLMIRPQQRRAREAAQMQSSLRPGAEVMTSSGIYGTVTEVDEEDGTVVLEISAEVYVRFARAAIARVLTPGPEPDEPEASAEPDDDAEPADHVDTDAHGPGAVHTEAGRTDVDNTEVKANQIIQHKD
jgi:preprotein translocase subunit YajC